jgi:hypothetical protein
MVGTKGVFGVRVGVMFGSKGVFEKQGAEVNVWI